MTFTNEPKSHLNNTVKIQSAYQDRSFEPWYVVLVYTLITCLLALTPTWIQVIHLIMLKFHNIIFNLVSASSKAIICILKVCSNNFFFALHIYRSWNTLLAIEPRSKMLAAITNLPTTLTFPRNPRISFSYLVQSWGKIVRVKRFQRSKLSIQLVFSCRLGGVLPEGLQRLCHIA